eukprot:UN25027
MVSAENVEAAKKENDDEIPDLVEGGNFEDFSKTTEEPAEDKTEEQKDKETTDEKPTTTTDEPEKSTDEPEKTTTEEKTTKVNLDEVEQVD